MQHYVIRKWTGDTFTTHTFTDLYRAQEALDSMVEKCEDPETKFEFAVKRKNKSLQHCFSVTAEDYRTGLANDTLKLDWPYQ